MRVQIMSDLHAEFYGTAAMPKLVEGTDFVIVAGDTCQGLVRAVETLRDAFPRTHHAMDFRRNATRLISNPRGHPRESTGFHPATVMEIADD